MRVLVTGGAGFVGAHLVRRLLDDGHEVVAVDNLSSGNRANIPDGAEFRWVDLTDESAGKRLGDKSADVVFHLASHVGQELSFELPLYDVKANLLSTTILLDWCLRHDVPRVVFASTMNLYGDPEDPQRPITESDAVRPPSPYAVGKIASEHLLDVYGPFGIAGTSLRLFNVYGPLQDMENLKQGMVSIFMSYVAAGKPVEVRGSGDRFRDFIFVDDVVGAFVRAAADDAKGCVLNVCSGRPTKVSELLEGIVRAFGHDPAEYPITYGEGTPRDQFGIYGDPSRLRALGWEPTVALDDGLERMARWVQAGCPR
jgi:UDP-glucose 4-epimerase